jgi:hypothetical protein
MIGAAQNVEILIGRYKLSLKSFLVSRGLPWDASQTFLAYGAFCKLIVFNVIFKSSQLFLQFF